MSTDAFDGLPLPPTDNPQWDEVQRYAGIRLIATTLITDDRAWPVEYRTYATPMDAWRKAEVLYDEGREGGKR